MKEQEVDKGVLMRNCEKIILETLNLISVLKIDKQTIKIYEKSPFKRAVKGLIYFSLMALIQLFSVDIQKLSIHVLENHSNIFNQQKQKQSDSQANLDNTNNIYSKQSYKPCSCSPQFTQNDDIKKIKHYIEIMKSQKLVGFIIEESQLKFYIDKWENLVLHVQWKSGIIFLKNDQSFQFEKAFKITETNFKFELPFGYSLTYCFINSKINLNIEQIEGDYDCNMIQTYRSLKQLEYLQGRILRYVRNKVMNFQRKESSLVPKSIKINIKSGKINVKEMQDFCDSDGLIGDKPRQIELNVDNLDLQIAYNQNDDILEQDLLLNIEEVDLNVDFLFNEQVNLAILKSCSIQALAKSNMEDSSLQYYMTSIEIDNSKINVHPVIIPLYNVYINLVLRSYLEYNWDIYLPLVTEYKQRSLHDSIKGYKIDYNLLAEIVQKGKRDIRQYIKTPHEITQIKLNEFEFYGVIQQNPLKQISVVSSNFDYHYETKRGDDGQIKGFQNQFFQQILLIYTDKSNILKKTLSNQSMESSSQNQSQGDDNSQIQKFEDYKINVFQKLSPSKSGNQFQVNYQTQKINNKLSKDQNPINNQQSHCLQRYEEKFGEIQKYEIKSVEDEQIISEHNLDKFKINMNDQQIKNMINFFNLFDLELYHQTRNKIFSNPYQYQNNPYEKKCISSTLYTNFEFVFQFDHTNKIKLLCDYYKQNQVGPNVLKMDSKKIFQNLQIIMEYQVNQQAKQVKFANINTLENEYYYKEINESIYKINGLIFKFDSEVKYIGDFFWVLKDKINEIQVHSEQIRNKMLKKKKKYIEQNTSSQIIQDKVSVSLENLQICLEEDKHNQFLKAYQAFTREYLSKQTVYNERECIYNLQKYKKFSDSPLLKLGIEKLGIELKPFHQMRTFKDIQNFIKKADPLNSHLNLEEQFFEAFRLLQVETEFINFQIQIRDYPFKIVDLQYLTSQAQFLLTNLKQTKNIYDKAYLQRLFYHWEIQMGGFEVNFGLCLSSGINEIIARTVQIFSQSPNQSKKSQHQNQSGTNYPKYQNKSRQQTENINLEKSLNKNLHPNIQISKQNNFSKNFENQQNQMSFFDQWRMNFHGKIFVQKPNKSNFNMLTHIYPYYKDALKLTLGKTYFFYESEELKLNIQSITFKRTNRPKNETHIFKIPKTQSTLNLKWNCKGKSSDHFFILNCLEQCQNQELDDFKSKDLTMRFNINFPKATEDELFEERIHFLGKKQNSAMNNKKNLTIQQKKFKTAVKNSEVIFFHYQQEFVEWIQNLPQLRLDILKLYAIKTPTQFGNTVNQNDIENLDEDIALKKETSYNIDEYLKEKKLTQIENNEKISTNQDIKQKKTQNQNEQRQSEAETETEDDDSNGQQKYTDYITLFQNSLNKQLNSSNKRGVLMKHVKTIQLFIQMENIRLNITNQKIEKMDFQENFTQEGQNMDIDDSMKERVIGIQNVFDSLNFSSEFYLRPSKINIQNLKSLDKSPNNKSPKYTQQFNVNQANQEFNNQDKNQIIKEEDEDQEQDKIENDQILEWAMRNGQGRINFVYSGVFTQSGKLLDLNPLIFKDYESKEESEFKDNFKNFFNLKNKYLIEKKQLFDLQDAIKNYSINFILANSKIYEKIVKNSLQKVMSQQENEITGSIYNLSKSKYSQQNDFCKKTFLRQDLNSNIQSNLKFDVQGVFFKSDQMIYLQKVEKELPIIQDTQSQTSDFTEQQKSQQYEKNINLQQNEKDINQQIESEPHNYRNTSELVFVKHYFTFEGCQMLMTKFLTNLIKNIFWRKEKNQIIIEQQQEKQNRQSHYKDGKQKQQEKSDKSQSNQQNTLQFSKSSKQAKKLFKKKPKQGDQKELKILNFAINIKNPQFNLNYSEKKTQLILASEHECYIIKKSNYLDFDKYNLDPQNQLILYFNGLDCYTIAKDLEQNNEVYWNSQYEKHQKIIAAKQAQFNITSYDLKTCQFDFSKPFKPQEKKKQYNESSIFGDGFGSGFNKQNESSKKPQKTQKQIDQEKKENKILNNPQYFWGKQDRSQNLLLYVESLEAQLTSRQYKIFQQMLEFLGKLMTSEEKAKNYKELIQKHSKEYNQMGSKVIKNHILSNLMNFKMKEEILYSQVIYKINNGNLSMLNNKFDPFLEFSISDLSSKTSYFKNNLVTFDFELDSASIINKQEQLKNTHFANVLNYVQEGQDKKFIKVHKTQYNIPGMTQDTLWVYFDTYDVNLPPLTIKLTEDIYQPFYDYLWSSPEQQQQLQTSQQMENSKNNLKKEQDFLMPQYYSNVLVKDLKFCIYYQCDSSIKRLNGVSVIIEPYTVQQQFWTMKDLFDNLSNYLKKQVTSQAFSLIGQKIFGYQVDIHEGEQKGKKKKK